MSQRGWVMLGVLAATALGLILALFAFAAADIGQRVGARDLAAARALAAAQAGVLDAVDRLTWGGLPGLWGAAGTAAFETAEGGATARVVVTSCAAGGGGVTFAARAEGRSGAATSTARLDVRLAARRLPGGLTVAGGLVAGAPLTLEGTGAYVGGDVRGRQWIDFPASAADGMPPDRVRDDLWTVAAVHAQGRVFADDVEVHGAGRAAPDDTDECTGVPSARHAGPGVHQTWPPGREWWLCLDSHATLSSGPTSGSSVDLEALAPVAAERSPGPPLTGHIAVVTAGGGPVAVSGWWPLSDDQPQLTLVVDGDVVLGGGPVGAGGSTAPGTDLGGAGGRQVALRGALLVTGRVTVAAPTVVVGFLAAGDLDVRAPLSLIVPSAWREAPPPGSLAAVPVAAAAVRGGRRIGGPPPPGGSSTAGVASAPCCPTTKRRGGEPGRSAGAGVPSIATKLRLCFAGGERGHVGERPAPAASSQDTSGQRAVSVRGLPRFDRFVAAEQRVERLKLPSIRADVCACMTKGRGIRGV